MMRTWVFQRQVGDEIEYARVVAADQVGESWKHDQGDEQLLALLQRHGAPCPECDYDLHGLTNIQCPECGTILKLETTLRSPSQDARFAARIILAVLGLLALWWLCWLGFTELPMDLFDRTLVLVPFVITIPSLALLCMACSRIRLWTPARERKFGERLAACVAVVLGGLSALVMLNMVWTKSSMANGVW